MDPDRAVAEVETDLYGTPDNVDGAPAWTAYTRDGIFQFEGLYLDGYIDQKIRFLARDDEILKVEEMVSDEIVYENAWISGFSGKTVTVFIGNIQREFPVKGVLKDESEISGQIGDLYLKGGTPKRLVLKKEKITERSLRSATQRLRSTATAACRWRISLRSIGRLRCSQGTAEEGYSRRLPHAGICGGGWKICAA